MKPTQILVLGLALAAGGGAYWVATNMAPAPVVVANDAAPVVVKAETVEVLVAGEAVPLGQALREERLRWQEWPKTGLTEGMVTKDDDPEGIEGHSKLIARATFYAGEPIRAEKLVRADRGYLSAILPRGMRAVAINVSADTSAGGFVLPNDRVDVMLTTRKDGTGGDEDEIFADVILENIRVLAIDQLIEEKEDGSKSVVGDTATLQVTPNQAAALAEARVEGGNSSSISLVLRSVADSGSDVVEVKASGGSKNIIRGGQVSRVKLRKAGEPSVLNNR